MLDSQAETTPKIGHPPEDPTMSQPTLSLADVEHVAALARLGLTAEEKVRLSAQLSSILEHISVLNQIDTSRIPPTAQVIEVANVLRDDEVRISLPRDAILANAPRSADGFFEVQAVLDGGEEDAE